MNGLDYCCVCKKMKPTVVSMMLTNCAHKIHISCLNDLLKLDYDDVACDADGCGKQVAEKDKSIVKGQFETG
jgi:hypothetical protein